MILSECVYILTYVTRGWLIVTDHGGFTLNHDSKTFRNLNLTYTIAAAIQENFLWLQEAQQVLGSIMAADGLIKGPQDLTLVVRSKLIGGAVLESEASPCTPRM